MKRLLFIALLSILIVGLFAGTPRAYTQRLINATDGGELPGVTNPSSSTSADYTLTAYVTTRPTEILSTNPAVATILSPVTTIRVYRFGNGTSVPYISAAFLQLGTFTTQWVAGDIVHLDITHIPTGQTASWELTIPTGTAAITYRLDTDVIPYVVCPPVPVLNPAVLVYPANGATGIDFNGVTLSWNPGTGIVPDGYKVYLGTDTPPTNIVNGTIQTETTYPTGLLTNNQAYYWQIVPMSGTDEAENCPVWAFSTNAEINPDPAINPSPANGTTVYTSVFPFDQILTWSPNTTGQAPTGYKIYWNGSTTFEDLGNVLTVTKNIPAAGPYTWKIVPYYTEPVTRKVTDGKPIPATLGNAHNLRGDALNCPTWNFTAAMIQYYTVDITSTPTGAAIFVNGVNSGFTTPHQFSMVQFSSATYTVQIAGYTWVPTSFVVTNITSNRTQNFVGTVQTFNCVITSNPTNADIFVNGVDSGFNTPHNFPMNYGTGATYTVQMAGYTWSPAQFVVTNITANTSQLFTGTLIPYTVDITSTPANADIYVNGVDSGFNTPHQFIMNYNTSATYTVQMAGYTWSPTEFVVTNIMSNQSQEFVGTIQTFTVDLTSTPTDANIYVDGVDSGFNTPHQFTMNYGTSATYTLQLTGYNWTPPSLVVNNIQSNITQNFVGALQTFNVDITSTPTNADIFIGGVDSGFNTPHVFVMNYGASATYTVQMAGYNWNPVNFVVTNIMSNLAQNFVGTLQTFTVDITSTPSDANIFVDGTDSGFNTPHQFVMNYGSSATYTVHMEGYIFDPVSYVVTNIMSNMSQAFTGELIFVNVTPETQEVTAEAGTFTVDITSNYNWIITEDVDWLSVDPMTGSLDGQFTVTYQANPLTSDRIGEITITAGLVVATVEITQLGLVGNDDQVEVTVPGINVYPNPFNANTNIKLFVKNGSDAQVNVYSIKGQLVKSLGNFNKGIHTISWNGKDETGRNCSSGFYFIRYKSAEFNKTVKVLMLQN